MSIPRLGMSIGLVAAIPLVLLGLLNNTFFFLVWILLAPAAGVAAGLWVGRRPDLATHIVRHGAIAGLITGAWFMLGIVVGFALLVVHSGGGVVEVAIGALTYGLVSALIILSITTTGGIVAALVGRSLRRQVQAS